MFRPSKLPLMNMSRSSLSHTRVAQDWRFGTHWSHALPHRLRKGQRAAAEGISTVDVVLLSRRKISTHDCVVLCGGVSSVTLCFHSNHRVSPCHP